MTGWKVFWQTENSSLQQIYTVSSGNLSVTHGVTQGSVLGCS